MMYLHCVFIKFVLGMAFVHVMALPTRKMNSSQKKTKEEMNYSKRVGQEGNESVYKSEQDLGTPGER